MHWHHSKNHQYSVIGEIHESQEKKHIKNHPNVRTTPSPVIQTISPFRCTETMNRFDQMKKGYVRIRYTLQQRQTGKM